MREMRKMEGILYLLQQLKGMVTPFSVFDLIDILIMAFIIYKVIMFIRRTSTGAVAKGILLLLVALLVSGALQLNTVNFLMGRIVEYGALALVILFQPEIRRFLEQMGRTNLGEVFTHAEERNELDSAITQTVEAYTSLSKSKTGALMVFERKNMLEDKHLRVIYDYKKSQDCFPGIRNGGGICYFLWDSTYSSDNVKVFNHNDERHITEVIRPKLEFGLDFFIRDSFTRNIVKKVLSLNEMMLSSKVFSQKPYGLRTNFMDFKDNVFKFY